MGRPRKQPNLTTDANGAPGPAAALDETRPPEASEPSAALSAPSSFDELRARARTLGWDPEDLRAFLVDLVDAVDRG